MIFRPRSDSLLAITAGKKQQQPKKKKEETRKQKMARLKREKLAREETEVLVRLTHFLCTQFLRAFYSNLPRLFGTGGGSRQEQEERSASSLAAAEGRSCVLVGLLR